LSLTDTGKTQFADMAAKHAAWVDEILSPLDDQNMQAITTMLDQIQRRVGDL
ncbi:MAG TPA: MarR family transcriptional regulator, partial [Oceanospirillaceae bacterium]|nr:MarR family transcriptional regulator [Oceanospirillaceae bacterium]